MKKHLFALLVTSSLCFAAPVLADETAITIYSKAQPGAINPNLYRPVNGQSGYNGMNVPGYGVVRQIRDIELSAKSNIIKYSDVAAYIDPTTVQFKSLTDPKGTKVGEQNYQFDLVSQQKLLEKYIDKKITVERVTGDKTESTEGTLMSVQGGLTLKTADGSIRAINGYSSIIFPSLSEGLITKPTLVWNIFTGKIGKHKSEVSYQTQGVTWWADYNLIYNEGKDANNGTVDFGSWVSIINQTGATFNDAKLKLMAGDVQQVSNGGGMGTQGLMKAKMEMMDAIAEAPSFAEKTFFEYHLYTLDTPVTLPDNSTKQLELIPAVAAVPVEKLMIFNGQQSQYWNYGGIYTDRGYGVEAGNKKVDVFLKLVNKKENGLGVPLPSGRIRVNQRDAADGSLEFIGESIIDHTARNEELIIKLGSAFDVVGERKQLNYVLDTNNRYADEEIEIKIRNQKSQAVKVKIVENMYRATGWKILSSSDEYKKDNAHQVNFMVNIAPEQEKTITYKVHYTW
jgi:hypothetical protein